MPITQLPGGSLRDEIRLTLYDTIDLTGSITNAVRSFFSNVQGKGISLTNLRQNSILENAVSYNIMGIAVDVQNFRTENVVAVPLLMENSGLDLTVGEKSYWRGPLRFAAGRLFTDVGGSTLADMTAPLFQQHGDSAVATVVLPGKHSIQVNPLQNFRLDWTLEGLTAAELGELTLADDTKLRYVASLKGIQRRPVQ